MAGLGDGLTGIAVLLVLLAAGMPVGFTMTVVGFFGVAAIYDWNWTAALGTLGLVPFAKASSYLFVTIPLFILMGQFTYRSGISQELFAAARRWWGHWPGGLAVATVGTAAGFSAVSGSSLATAAAVGMITIPEMRKHGVDRRMATGVVAAGGTLGILIPPSIGMVIYGLVTEQSIGQLLIAGLLPGLLLVVLFIAVVMAWSWIIPDSAPAVPRASWAERLRAAKGVLGIVVLIVLVMGGIYGGVFTPTEAAAIGAFGAFLIAVARRRLSVVGLLEALDETAKMTGMIFMIIIGSHVMNVFLAATQVPEVLSKLINGLDAGPHVTLVAILIVYLVLGCFLDVLAMIVLTIPIVFPVLMSMGFDPIWFGVIVVLVMEMALITPPVGMNVYVIKGVAPDVPLRDIFAGVWPFLAAQIATAALLMAFPQIALWLPGLMF